MTGVAAVIPKAQFKDALGIPLVGGTLDVFIAGSTTRTNTWQDKAQTTLNTNPITLDSRGECLLWLDVGTNYKFVLKSATGVTQWTVDNISGEASAFDVSALSANLANSSDNTLGASLVGHQGYTLYDRVSGRVFAVKDNTQAGILAARAKAVAAGGGTVLLPDATITLTAAIPADPYVFYEGVEPRRTLGVIPDNTWTFTGGTILKGNGTFNGFEGNVTPQGAAATTAGGVYANQSIQGFGLRNIGFDTLLSGVAMGATNILGPVFCHFENLWAVNCTSWGFTFVNWMHSHFDRLFIANCAHGMYFGADEPTATLLNGNSRLSRLYVNQPNLLGRGIVFEGATGASQGEIEAVRLQVNRFGTAGGTQSATMVNTSTSIGVTDLTKFSVGCPVSFTTTANGFTADLTYMVLTVSGSSGAGNITVATKRSGAAIAATGATAITIRSLGMPNMEICGLSSNAASGCRFLNLDLEGASGVTLYMENTGNCEVQLTAVSTATSNVVQRAARHTVMTCLATNVTTDFDSNSFETVWMGPRQGTIRQRRGWGMWRNSADRVGLSLRSTLTGDGWDIFEQSVNGGSVLGVGTAMGAKVNATVGGTVAIDGGRAGVVPVVFGGGSALTLFTIATADIGTEFLFVNVGTSGNATLNTDGTQVFNGQTGKTQLVIPIGGAVRVIAQSTSNWLAAGSFLLDTVSGSKTFDPASIANGAQTTTTVTATGAVLGDQVDAWTNIDQAGVQVTGYVSAADTVTVIYSNTTGGAVDLASHTLRVRARKN